MSELRQLVRRCFRHAGFSISVICTLAVAIALVTAVVTVIDCVLLRPLPFANAERIASLWESPKTRVAAASFHEWRERSRSFDRMALYGYASYTVTGLGDAFQVSGARVMHDYFPILGVTPIAGRTFTADEFRPGREPVAIVSHGMAVSRFGSPQRAIGKAIRLDQRTATIVGVMPAQVFPARASAVGVIEFLSGGDFVWVPMPMPPFRNSHVFGVLARLRDGATLDQARAELGSGVRVLPLVEEAVGVIERPLWIASAAVALVLLIACANVAGLLLVRASDRARELEVRRAIGANSWNVFAQFAGEAVLLSIVGGIAGVLLAVPAVRLLPVIVPRDVPRLSTATIDLRIAAGAALLSILCGLAVALVPLLQSRRGSRITGHPLRSVLVLMQSAIAVVLLIGAGLLVRTLSELRNVDPGFETTNMLVASFVHSDRYDTPDALTSYYDRLFERLRALPEVVSVAAAYDPPLQSNWSQGFELPGMPQSDLHEALFRTITPDYFATTGVELVQGRAFTERDDARNPGAIIVNEAFASRFLGGTAIGRKIRVTTTQWVWGDRVPNEFEVVGVAEDERFVSVDTPPAPAFYIPFRQTPHHKMSVLLRTRRDPRALIPALRAIARETDAGVPVAEITTLRDIIAGSVARPRFSALMLTVFAAVALFLTLLGTGALIAQTLRQRRRELGLRMALGATPSSIGGFVLGRGLLPALAGVAIGIPLALPVSRLLRHLLFGVTPSDPLVYMVAIAVMLLGATVACIPAAARAAKIDPAKSLREE